MLGESQQNDKHSPHCPLKYPGVIEAQSFSMDFENLDSQEPPAKRARQETELELPAHQLSKLFKVCWTCQYIPHRPLAR